MKPIVIQIILVVALIVGTINTSHAQSAEQLYQKGLVKEQGEGALQEAIVFFNQVADNSNADIPLRAKALLHVGMCFEKLGTEEAAKAYQRLVNSFPSQKNEVAIARERLSRLIQVPLLQNEVAEVHPKSMTLQKVWSGSATIMWGAPSPDGRFLTFSDPATLNLAIRELSSGKTSVLTKDAAENPLQFNMGSTVSPDNKQIAYAWYKNNHEIRLIDIDNHQPRLLYGNKDEDVYPCAWSPDGKTIYAKSYLNKTGQCRILAITVATGDIQILKTFNFFYWLQLCVSPDNQFIIYDFPNLNNGNIADADIYLISTDGKNETTLIKHPANDYILGWLPDKNQILFKSDRSGTWDAWTVSVINGKVSGEPRRVMTEIGENATQMGFTKNGTFYYSLFSRKFNAFTAPFDQTKGELKSESAKPILGSICAAKWSPSGKSLALIKELWNQDRRPLFLMDAETGEERMLSDRFNIRHLLWLQDSKTLLVLGNDEKRESEKNYTGGMYTINVQSEEVTELISFSDYRGKDWEIGLLVAQMLAKGNTNQKCIYYLKNGQLISREIETGQENILLQNEIFNSNNYTMDLKPDGGKLLFCNEDQIYIIPTAGGKQFSVAKVLTTTTGPTVPNSAVWAQGENYIFYTENTDSGSILWRASAEGENPIKVWQSKVPISSLSIHPDGQEIVIATINQESEIWQVNNFLPLEKLQKENEIEELFIRKALADTDIEPLGSPSPDGRYISFTDRNSGGNIGILNLETKERRLLTDFKDPNEQAYYSSWSPDGKQIAYFWWRYDKDQYNLSVVDVDKPESRVLFISDKNNWIELGNWSSDGRYIFATLSLRDEPKSQIISVSAADGTIKVLKTCEESYTGGKPYVSPDNRYVAYDLPDKDASGNSDIFTISLENGQENTLIKHPSHDYILGWTPDGKNILFASDRSGTVDAMTIAVKNGKPDGNLKPVKQNIGQIDPMGFTQYGSFYYGQWPGERNIYTAEFDFEEGKVITKPTLAIQKFEGKNGTPSYSNDGEFLAYISQRGVIRKGKPGIILCIRELETGKEQEIIPPLDIASSISYPTWSPDDRSIALMCRNEDGQQKIYNYNTQTREFSRLVADTSDMDYIYPQWSADGKLLYYFQISQNSQISRIMVRNITTEIDKELYQFSSDNFKNRLFIISLSPDGKYLAAINRSENRVLKILSTEGGISRDLYSFKWSGESGCPLIWSKDGKYIIFAFEQPITEGHGWNLMRIPVNGGEKLKIEMNILGISSPSLHPDGRRLSFSSLGYSLPENNIWEMKNLLQE